MPGAVLPRIAADSGRTHGFDRMSASKSHILAEINRLAEASGKPPGVRLFERETGIKESDWYPDLWLRWGDALQEAGFTRNTMQEGFRDELLVEHYARLAQRLSHLPLQGEIIRESKANPAFPSEKTYRRFGGKPNLLKAVAEFCRGSAAFADVLALCQIELESQSPKEGASTSKPELGYVYLFRHGAARVQDRAD